MYTRKNNQELPRINEIHPLAPSKKIFISDVCHALQFGRSADRIYQNTFDISVCCIKLTRLLMQVTCSNQMELELWDTAGQEDFDRLRPLSYPDTDVLLVCFSVVSPDSLTNVFEKWAPEVKHFCQEVPIILVGTKRDLRTDPKVVDTLERTKQKPVSFEEGCLAAEHIGAYGYCECSAKTCEGIIQVFEMGIEASMKAKRVPKLSEQKSTCTLF